MRQEQMAALAIPHRDEFVAKTLDSLARLFPGDARLADERAMRAMIDDAIARAGAYGIDDARELSLFVFLVHELGAGFEAAPERRWMLALLRDDTLDARTKLDVIYTRLELAQRRGA